ncbi:tripartite tricarboxylate transporter substrate binding protein [Roseomonas eburnea]|uniref:Tripartite tricarboxylate transporter substrate binding protein n=1 Tax=Neoroseomonas eburnea TaxID=1346889 RepID=A0A9X9XBW6_9PROT|nr:tripartite tricarboxylate transporter substrate binding protein [Neoroseomonas eburnea]MBR0681202.1 tripartite tricarboxylate transporter substrate binding protein [Neoroseomonas eburnea]
MTDARTARIRAPIALLAAGLLPRAATAQAEDPAAWPSRPIRLIAPYPPGGQTDIVGRWLAERLRAHLPQPMIVENRAGAQGMIGTQAALQAPADGYTVLYINASTSLINPVIHANPGYDTLRDMAPVVQFGTAALVLTVRADRPIASVADLVAEARRRPGELSYASFGVGSASHLFGAMLEKAADIRMSHIPYRGSAPAVQDVIAGHAFLSINDEAVSIPQIRDGRLKPLAVTGPVRIPALPDVPTFAEAGYPGGLELLGFNGLVMRSGTHPTIIRRFSDAVLAAIGAPEARERLRVMGLEPTLLGPEAFAAQLRRDAGPWGQAARDSGARVE